MRFRLPHDFQFSPRWITATKLAALLFLIIGAKFCLISTFSTPLPFFDQWRAEGGELIQRSLHGTLGWRDLFEPHNQHRIVWTRLLVLGLFKLNGVWDTQVEMIAAAGFHALCAVVLGAILIRRLGRAEEDKILFCLAFLFLLPFGWEDTLSAGFQSLYYFLILLSVVAIWGLAMHRPWTGPWWIGLAAGVLAWFSAASGWFAGVAVAASAAFWWWREKETRRDSVVTFAASVFLIAGGLCLLFGTVGADESSRAGSVGEFLWKFCGLLGWPNQTPWAVFVAYAPLGWTLWRGMRGGWPKPTRTDGFVVLLAGWVILQTVALAYVRNHYRALDVSRYMDVQCLGTLANFACLLTLAQEMRTAGADVRKRAALRSMQVVWVVLTIFGLYRLTDRDLRDELPFVASNNASEERAISAYVNTLDPRTITDKTWRDVQCDTPQDVVDLLIDPAMRAVMPPRVKQPLPLPVAHGEGKVHRLEAGESSSMGVEGRGWLLASPPAGQPASVFRSKTILTSLRRLQFQVLGAVGPGAQLDLIGERSGQSTPLLPDAGTGTLWSANVQTPAEPFYLSARVESGNRQVLAFFEPVGTGPLTIWVDPLLRSATGFLFVGVLLWMGAAAYRQRAREPMPSESEIAPEIDARRSVAPVLPFAVARETKHEVGA